MPWIDDVVTRTTILSTWGNTIRDHAVAIFATVAERDANAAKMVEGALCVSVADRSVFVRRAAAANGFGTFVMPPVPFAPQVYLSGVLETVSVDYAYWQRIAPTRVAAAWRWSITGPNYSGTPALNFQVPVPAAANAGTAKVMIGAGFVQDLATRAFGHIELQNANFAVLINPATGAAWTAGGGYPFMTASIEYEVPDG